MERIKQFIPQKEVVYNKHLPYADKLDEESERYLSEIKHFLSYAIQRKEIYPEGIFWINQLAKYIELHGQKFSKDDHCHFIHLLIEVVVIKDLPLHCVVNVGSVLYVLLKKIDLLTREDIEIDWRILYELYERIIFNPSEQYGMAMPPSNIENVLKGLIRVARPYFSLESTQEMLDEWRPELCIFDTQMLKAISYLTLFLCTKLPSHQHDKGFKLWLPELMTLWENGQNSPIWENNLLWLFSRLARDNVGYIDWEPYIPLLFGRLMRSFNLPSGPNKVIVQGMHTSDHVPMLIWIISMLGAGSKCQKYLNCLFKALESYYHPSNNGRWIAKLQRILHRLPGNLIKRINRERYKPPTWEMPIPKSHHITDAEITEFVLAMKPVVLLAMFSKVGSNDSCLALHNLALLRPEIIIPPVVERLYSSLETVTEPHRLTAALNCTGAIARSMVQKNSHFPEGPSHVIPLLMGSLPGLDSNDIRKCLTTFHFISTISSLVFLVDSSKSADDPNHSEAKRELCLASAAFEDFVLQFMDRCFVLIANSRSNQPARMDRNADSNNTEETLSRACLSSTFCTLIAHCSPEIYKVVLQKLYTFVTTNIFEIRVSGKTAASMCRSAVKVFPEISLQKFMPYFSRVVLTFTESDEVLQEESLDNELLFSLLVISEILKSGGVTVLKYLDTIIALLNRTLHLKCQEGYSLACKILYSLLHTLTSIGVMDYCSIANFKSRCQATDNHTLIDDWGRSGDLNNLGLNFHVPTEDEVIAVRQLLELFLVSELKSLQKWVSGDIALNRDQLRNSLCIVDSSLFGASGSLPLWSNGTVKLSDSPIPLQSFPIQVTVSKDVNSSDGKNFREMIFETILSVLDHMLQVSEDDVKSLLFIISIYQRLFFHWGETKDDFEAKWKGFHLIKKSLTDKLHGKKQHIRIFLVDRILLQHYMREVERNKSRFTKRHEQAMYQLFNLATSHYHNVRSRAQNVLQSFVNCYPYSYKLILPKLLSSLAKDPIHFHEEFKGALYMILNFKQYSLITARHWDLLNQLWPALVSMQLSEKLSIIRLLDTATDYVPKYIDTVVIKLKVNEKCISLAKDLCPQNDSLILNAIDENAERHYVELVENLVSLINTGNLHWRLYQLAFVMLSVCIRSDVAFPVSAIRLFVTHLVDDTLIIRKISIASLGAILQQQKRKHPCIEIDPYCAELLTIQNPRLAELQNSTEKQPSNTWLQYNSSVNLTVQSEWDKWVFVHKTHIGFTIFPKPLKVYAPYSQQPKLDRSRQELSDGEAEVYDFFMQSALVDKLIGFLSLEERKGHDKFDLKRFEMWKSLFRNFGVTFLPQFVGHLNRLVKDKQESSHRCAAEITAGLLRGSKHWNFEMTMQLKQALTPIFQTVLKVVNPETLGDWAMCLSSSTEGRDPNRFFWLYELLMEGPCIEESGSFLESSWLYLLLNTLMHQHWRACELNYRMLNILLPKLNHSYQNVREKIGCMLSNIFVCDIPTPYLSNPLVPKQAEFLRYIAPKVSILETTSPGDEGSPTELQTGNGVEDMEASEISVSESGLSINEEVAENAMEVDVNEDTGANNHINNFNQTSSKRKDAAILFNTICRWLKLSIMRSYHVIQPELFLLLPVLCSVQNDTSDEALQKEYVLTYTILSQIVLIPSSIRAALDSLKLIMEKSSWHSKASGLKFLQHMVFTNIFTFVGHEEWLTDVKEMILRNLHDQSVEVREAAAEALSGLLHCEILKVTEDLLKMFKQKCSKRLRRQSAGYSRSRGALLSPEELCERHAGVLGLCACINSFPYDVPDFMPEILVLLADHLNDPQPIQTTITKTLSNFRRTHHDSWRDHKLKFTEDQLTVITDWLVSPSYYA